MIYRRFLPIAASAVALAGGFFTLSKPSSGMRYSGSRLNDNGLNNYAFVDKKKFELINATVFLRHGARTPNYFIDSKYDMPDWESGVGYVDMVSELDYDANVVMLPSKTVIDEDSIMDEYIEHVKGKCQWGQLTLIGQEQSIAFGKELKRIYMHGYNFIQKDFNENEIYCRSTKFPRTFYTMKGILAGVYGIESFDKCNRPTINIMSIETDPLYPNTRLCPVIGKFIVSGAAEISKDPEIIKMKCLLKNILGVESLRFTSPGQKSKDYDETKPNLKKGQDTVAAPNVPIYAVRDDLFSRQVHDFTVPSDFAALLPELNRLSSEEILYEYLGGSIEWEDRMAILVSPVINIIKHNMEIAINKVGHIGQPNACVPNLKDPLTKTMHAMKMQLVACHDTTLIPLLVCLRIYDGQWPNFMSNLIVELYKEKSSGNLFTRLVYNGKVQRPRLTESDCDNDNEYFKAGMIRHSDFITFINGYAIPDEKYTSACDKVLKLFTSGKPITRSQFI